MYFCRPIGLKPRLVHLLRSTPNIRPASLSRRDKGVPQGATQNTLVATYGDLANVEELIKGGDVAAVILEPVVGNSGYIAPTKVINGLIWFELFLECWLVFPLGNSLSSLGAPNL